MQWVSAVEGCPLSGVPLYLLLVPTFMLSMFLVYVDGSVHMSGANIDWNVHTLNISLLSLVVHC